MTKEVCLCMALNTEAGFLQIGSTMLGGSMIYSNTLGSREIISTRNEVRTGATPYGCLAGQRCGGSKILLIEFTAGGKLCLGGRRQALRRDLVELRTVMRPFLGTTFSTHVENLRVTLQSLRVTSRVAGTRSRAATK